MPGEVVSGFGWSRIEEIVMNPEDGKAAMRWHSLAPSNSGSSQLKWPHEHETRGAGLENTPGPTMMSGISRTFAGVAFVVSSIVPGSYSSSMNISGQIVPIAQTAAEGALAQPRTQLRWLNYVMGRLDDLENAGDDLRPSADALASARTLVFQLLSDNTRSPSVVPSDNGGVMLAWHQAGVDLYLTFEDRDSFAWARQRASERVFLSGRLSDHHREVQGLLEKLTD